MMMAAADCYLVTHCVFKSGKLRHTGQRLQVAHEQLACRLWRGLLLATFLNIQSGLFYDLLSNFMGKGDKVRQGLTASDSPVQHQCMLQRARVRTGLVSAFVATLIDCTRSVCCMLVTTYEYGRAHRWSSARQETFPYAFTAANASYSVIATPAGSVGVTKCACFGIVCSARLLLYWQQSQTRTSEHGFCTLQDALQQAPAALLARVCRQHHDATR
jgi:hypothetical protein